MTCPELDLVECSICSAHVPSTETCSTLACRACHKSLSLEECIESADRHFKGRESLCLERDCYERQVAGGFCGAHVRAAP